MGVPLGAWLQLIACALLTFPLMPLQALLVRLDHQAARTLPYWYHRQICRLLGIEIDAVGTLAKDRAVLVIANHSSWIDIPLISALGPVSFVAKSEVARWPFAGTLARLQRTIFVERERRVSAGQSANEIAARLAKGDLIVLFAEGTSSDGNRIRPFKTSLFGSVKSNQASSPLAQANSPPTAVQTVTVFYSHAHGIPLGWFGRRAFGYYGDSDLGANAKQFLSMSPLRARVLISPPVALDAFKDRKALAAWTEQVMTDHFQMLRCSRKTPALAIETQLPEALPQ